MEVEISDLGLWQLSGKRVQLYYTNPCRDKISHFSSLAVILCRYILLNTVGSCFLSGSRQVSIKWLLECVHTYYHLLDNLLVHVCGEYLTLCKAATLPIEKVLKCMLRKVINDYEICLLCNPYKIIHLNTWRSLVNHYCKE